jgi:thiol:disulfide interchange protein DsbC
MSGKDPGKASCPNPVGELTELAKSLGIGGTPTVLADDGTQISSQIAMSPDRLAAELDRLAAKNVAQN